MTVDTAVEETYQSSLTRSPNETFVFQFRGRAPYPEPHIEAEATRGYRYKNGLNIQECQVIFYSGVSVVSRKYA